MKFCDRLREQRTEKNYKQKDLAEMIGVSVTCYAGYEQGYREPDFKTLVKICRALKVSSDYLLGLED